ESEKVSFILKSKLTKKGVEIIEFKKDAIHNTKYFSEKPLDFAIAIGGDGTTIKAFRTLPSEVPVLCVNAGGTRGILSEVSKDSINKIIEPLLNGEFFLD